MEAEEDGMSAPNFTPMCQCGTDKEKGALFCDDCYEALPDEIRNEINVRVSDYKRTAEKASHILIVSKFHQKGPK